MFKTGTMYTILVRLCGRPPPWNDYERVKRETARCLRFWVEPLRTKSQDPPLLLPSFRWTGDVGGIRLPSYADALSEGWRPVPFISWLRRSMLARNDA